MEIVFIEKDNRNRTWAEILIFTGEVFKVRYISGEHTTDGDEALIAGDELLNSIHSGEWGGEYDGFLTEVPEDAPNYDELKGESKEEIASQYENVYDNIFFFTDDSTLYDLNDDKLIQEMKEENEDCFL